MIARAVGLAAGLLALCAPARAERLITALSTEQVGVTSYFTGTEVALFSVIETDAQSLSRRGAYSAVVVVTGPGRTQITQKKQQLLGFWVNGQSRAFVAAPMFRSTLSSLPLTEIADERVRANEQLGLAQIRFTTVGRLRLPDDEATFRAAFLAHKVARKLYVDDPTAITFLTPTVFRARIALPADVPIGDYTVSVLLLADGGIVARSAARFSVEKQGFEASLYRASLEQPALYGLGTVALALFMGWIAGVMFRRN